MNHPGVSSSPTPMPTSADSSSSGGLRYDKINRSVSFGVLEKEKENQAMISSMSTSCTFSSSPPSTSQGQRKLPNGISNANSSTTALKGILIKPKRLLPAQPDGSKVKRLLQETSHYKPTTSSVDKIDKHSVVEVTTGETGSQSLLGAGGEPADQSTSNSTSSGDGSVSSPQDAIDVDKLKSHFGKYGFKKSHSSVSCSADSPYRFKEGNINSVGANSIEKNTNNITSNVDEKGNESAKHEYGNIPGLTRERTIYDFSEQGLSKVEEWCSPQRGTSSDVKMTSDPTIVSKLKMGVRSPSPRSNTTWDRSSSGYSSDERQDPRSPPPPSTAESSSVKSSSGDFVEGHTVIGSRPDVGLHSSAHLTTVSRTNVTDRSERQVGYDRFLRFPSSPASQGNREAPSPNSCSNTIEDGSTADNGDRELCGCGDKGQRDNSDTYGQSGISDTVIDALSVAGRQQSQRRPAWTSNNQPTNNGKIQYRKSGSESVINLRHSMSSSRNNTDVSTGGLEVFGKSFKQTTSSGDAGETSSADGVHRGDNVSPERVPGTPQSDLTLQEFPIRPKPIRRKTSDLRFLPDMRNLSLNANMSVPRDDKDIRKSLQDLNSPRRRSTTGKAAPIRARHTIQVSPNQPTTAPGTTASQQPKTQEVEGKPGIKFFGKKMWRAPSGQPEGVGPRPFSPFGGTLPPSKIKKKQIYEVLV